MTHPKDTIWVCKNGHALKNVLHVNEEEICFRFIEEGCPEFGSYEPVQCKERFIAHIPLSSVQELVAALEEIYEKSYPNGPTDFVYFIAEEALQKFRGE